MSKHHFEALVETLETTPAKQITFYFLKDYVLSEVEIETVIDIDDRTEITFKKLDSDEGGNLFEDYNEGQS